MASPPRNPGAGSPPYPNPLALPQSKKRASSGLSISSSMPSAKRRKSTLHSIASTPGGSHPLRQTSFPPEESTLDPSAVRSPSVDSDITAATGARSIATTATVVKGRRGRKRKPEGSVISGKNTVRPSVEGNSAKGGGDDAEEEEDDEDGEMGLINQGEVVDKDTEKENLAVLIGAFNEDQSDRYEVYRRTILNKDKLRKIVNHTVSQSVPSSILTTINGYTKIFLGTLIERAREIQQQQHRQQQQAAKHLPTPPLDSLHSLATSPDVPLDMNIGTGGTSSFHSDIFSPGTVQADQSSPSTNLNTQASTDQHPQEPLGPLLPDHLREAIRRYKMNGESGGTGVQGLSLRMSGKGLCAARLNGGRLFR